MHASRRSGGALWRLRSLRNELQLEFDYTVKPTPKPAQKRTERFACLPFDGPEKGWREKAATKSWIELGVDHVSLSWPTPTCGTPLCLNLTHLAWESPKRLEYPVGICVYCGVIAGTKDHLLPRTWTGEAVRKSVLTVPACGECNSAISDRYAPSINERREIAHRWIFRKKRKVLEMPEWDEESIAELGPTLRSSIRKGMRDQKLAAARLAWPEDPDYDLRAMQLSGIENPYELGLLTDPATRSEQSEPTPENSIQVTKTFDNQFEIRDGKKRYTVKRHGVGLFFVTTTHGQVLKQTSEIHRRIANAVRESEKHHGAPRAAGAAETTQGQQP